MFAIQCFVFRRLAALRRGWAKLIGSVCSENAMEEELRCPACKRLFQSPVLLPCGHALCLNCALCLQQPASGEDQAAEEVDKVSILSETDSGVVCTSRPNSYVGTPSALFPTSVLSLSCPQPGCRKPVYFDENGAENLPRYRAMQNMVDKYGEAKKLGLKCQLCPDEPAQDASVLCEQCEVLYCDSCRENCHPSRGPLAKHTLLPPLALKAKPKEPREPLCNEHPEEHLTMYCMVCKTPVCKSCLLDSRHNSHDLQPINAICKAQKVGNAIAD